MSLTDRAPSRAGVGGFELAYQDVGSGPPVVLLHGFPFDRSMWYRQAEHLAASCRVITPDLRGHGASDAPPAPYRMLDFVEDIRTLVDRLELETIVLAGLSMGGYIALAFAERYPERLGGLALLATRADADSTEGRDARHTMAAAAENGGAAAIVDAMTSRLIGERQLPALEATLRTMILGTSVEGLVGSLLAMAGRASTSAVLGSLELPSLVVVGSVDEITPPPVARSMAAVLRDVELVEIPGAGHVVALEEPEAVNEALARLVERVVHRHADS